MIDENYAYRFQYADGSAFQIYADGRAYIMAKDGSIRDKPKGVVDNRIPLLIGMVAKPRQDRIDVLEVALSDVAQLMPNPITVERERCSNIAAQCAKAAAIEVNGETHLLGIMMKDPATAQYATACAIMEAIEAGPTLSSTSSSASAQTSPDGFVSVELLNIERAVSDDLRERNAKLRAQTPLPVFPSALEKVFEDHYWDTFQEDRELIMAHVRAVLREYQITTARARAALTSTECGEEE